MGNQHSGAYSSLKPRKNVHWKTAERPSTPGKPEIIPIASEDEPNAVTLKWALPKHDGGAPLQGFQVECNRIGSAAWIHTSPSVVTKPELILTGLEPGFRYQFRVAAVNAVSVSEPSELSDILTISTDHSPITAPKFLTKLLDRTALENETTEFKVTFVGVPPPTIAWFKDGFEIFSSRRTGIVTDDNSSVLVFHQTLLSDEGAIKCTATNRAGHAVAKAILSLEAAPKLRYPRQYEDGLLYEINETIFLKTSVVGKPVPDIEWRHDGQPLRNNDRVEISNTAKFSILRIHTAQRSDRGEYQIHAKNNIGEDTAAFLVTITAPPDAPRSITVIRQVDKSVTLSWHPPEDDGGCRVGNYIIEYYRSGWNVWLKATTSRKLSATLFDLIEGSEYRFRVKAESPYGMSEPSEESTSVLIPGKSVDMNFLAIESRIINDALIREDGEDVQPAVSPRRKRSKKGSIESSSEQVPERTSRDDMPLNEKEEPVVLRRRMNAPSTSMQQEQSPVGSSEFMLVLYPEKEKSNADKRKSFQLDLEDALSPPPISLSAPELNTRFIPFRPIRNSVSSTELLHERAMDRFYKAVAMKENQERENSKETPKENNKKVKSPQPDTLTLNDRIPIGKSPLKKASTEESRKSDLININNNKSSPPFVRPEIIIKTDSIEGKEYSYDKSESDINNDCNKWQNASFDEDYTASTVSSDEELSEEGSLGGEMERASQLTDDDITYNPRDKLLISSLPKYDKAVEVLTKPAPLPDPNFIPKPILKRREAELPEVRDPDKKTEKNTLFKKFTKMPLQKSFAFTKKETKKEMDKEVIKANNKENKIISPLQEELIEENDIDDGKIIIEHYGNIVREYGGSKKPSIPLYLRTEDLKQVAEKQQQNNKMSTTLSKPAISRKIKTANAEIVSKKKSLNTSRTKQQKSLNLVSKSPAPANKDIEDLSSTSKENRVASHSKEKKAEKMTLAIKKTARATIVIPIDFDELEQQAKVNVRTAIDYTIDVCLLLLAFWFYLFKDERLAIPFLVLIIYRQVQEVLFRNIPMWIRQHTPRWLNFKKSS